MKELINVKLIVKWKTQSLQFAQACLDLGLSIPLEMRVNLSSIHYIKTFKSLDGQYRIVKLPTESCYLEIFVEEITLEEFIKRKELIMKTKDKTLTIVPPEGYMIDEENSSFSQIVFKAIEGKVLEWKDLGTISGYYIDSMSEVTQISEAKTKNKYNAKIFKTKEDAKSTLAYAQLTQLYPHYDTSGINEQGKYRVIRKGNILYVVYSEVLYSPFTFDSEEDAKLFLKEQKSLLETYFKL